MWSKNNQIGENYDTIKLKTKGVDSNTYYDRNSTEITFRPGLDIIDGWDYDDRREYTDRRKPGQRRRTAEDKEVLIQKVWNNHIVNINDPDRLKHMSDTSNLTWEFEKDDLLIHKWRNWSVTLKHAPFSEKDFMVVYTWKSSKLTNIGWLSWKSVIAELSQILNTLFIWITNENSWIFNPDKEMLSIWNNITVLPWSWEAQSLREPHIHFSIFSTVEWTKNNVETTIDKIWNNKNVFPLNKVNLLLIRFLEAHLTTKGIIPKREITLDNQDYLALEIKLWDRNTFLFADKQILSIYREINKFIKSINLWYINNLLKEVDSEFNHNRLSYSVWFSYRDWNLVMRIRFTYRNKELDERWGAAANWLQLVYRVDWIPQPDQEPHKENIKKIIHDRILYSIL